MSMLFGPVRQLGFVVHDLEAAMRHWTQVMRVGPFFHFERAPLLDFRHRGQPSDLWISAALGQCGPLQVELIQQRNDAPSMYREFLQQGREGLQHVAFWADEKDYDGQLARAQEACFTIAMQGCTVDATGRFVYFDQQQHPGTVIELSCITAAKKKVFDRVAEAAARWDGREPVIRMDAR